jgi:hypothetical protein
MDSLQLITALRLAYALYAEEVTELLQEEEDYAEEEEQREDEEFAEAVVLTR